jgi:RND superfamily putative drug exporter
MRSNLAARAGRWSASHWKTATFGWLSFVVAAVLIGGAVGTKQLGANDGVPGESGRAEQILKDDFEQPAGELVLVQSSRLTTQSPAFAAAIGDIEHRLGAASIVTNIRSPLDPAHADQVSRDRHSAIVRFDVRGDPDTASDRVAPVVAAVDGARAEHPAVFIGGFGNATADKEVNDQFNSDLGRAGLLSLPVTIVILIVAFGALVAAGIPLLLGLTAVLATMGLLAIPSQFWPVDQAVNAVVLLIGLAVGVDYSLFYLKREREERAAGRSESAALEAAAATSGRSVLISGLTVMAAMAGMFLTGDKTFMSFAMATILVVAIAVVGSLTVLPALLSRLGDKVNKGRIPFLQRFQKPGGGRFWGWIIDRVLRRPVLSAALSAGFLLALAAPALGLNTVVPRAEALPQDLSVVKVYKRLQNAFPGEAEPAVVVVRAQSIDDPSVQQQLRRLERNALATGQVHEPITVDVNPARTVARIELPIDGNGTDAPAYASLSTIRNQVIPGTIGTLDAVDVAVTGPTAQSRDFENAMRSSAPLVFAFVLALAFVLLLVAFRSLVIAAKAIVLNLLSVAAAFGVLVLVFQHSWAKGILGFDYSGGVMVWLPVFLFVILFGLSMDYHVFILSRIREAHDGGKPTDEAIAYGIKSTAGVVTSAALVMVCVFSIFGTLSLVMMKQFGVGLAVAVLLDATVVRGVLLPATMKLLGEWNWYLPRWLDWLPQLRLESAPSAPPAKAT